MTIPTLTLRLLDIPMSNEPDIKKLLLNGAKDLLRAHKELAEERGIDLQKFHNKEIIYTAIQMGRYQGSPEWTAIGHNGVAALKLWYELFQKENTLSLKNTIKILSLIHI